MIDKLEVLSIKAMLLKDPEYFERRVRRYYSEKFHTPLHEVYNLSWTMVFNNYLEHIIETNNNKEDIYEIAIDLCYPEIAQNEEQDLQDWIERVEREENTKRAKKKKQDKENPHNEKKNNTIENPHIEKEQEEINMSEKYFSHLEQEMEENDDD